MTIDELLKACNAATTGLWESTRGGVIAITDHDPTGRPFFESIPATAADNDFIALARTALPAALRALKRLRELSDEPGNTNDIAVILDDFEKETDR